MSGAVFFAFHRLQIASEKKRIQDFPEVLHHQWDVNLVASFDWESLQHDGWDWNSTQDISGLHYTNRNSDMALPPEKQRAIARSVLFDDEYDEKHAKAKNYLFSTMDMVRVDLMKEVNADFRVSAPLPPPPPPRRSVLRHWPLWPAPPPP